MRAIQVNAYGGSKELALADVPVPEPGDGEVLVRLAYAGINFIDVYMRQGVYKNLKTYRNEPPFTLGLEGAGTVDAVGAGVHGRRTGAGVSATCAGAPRFPARRALYWRSRFARRRSKRK